MDAEMTKQRIDNAIRMGNDLFHSKPENQTLPIILKQLTYLKEVFERDHSFLAVPRGKMTFGVIAAKEEYDEIFPAFADLLHEISWDLDH